MKATASKKKSVVSPIAADVGAGRRFGIVVSEFHRDIGEKLLRPPFGHDALKDLRGAGWGER